MAEEIVCEDRGKNQGEVSGSDDARWEEECYDHGCRAAREKRIVIPVDIARLTTHNIESVCRYIKTYKDVLLPFGKGFNVMEMVRVTGRGRSTILQYRKLAHLYHPELDKSGGKGETEAT